MKEEETSKGKSEPTTTSDTVVPRQYTNPSKANAVQLRNTVQEEEEQSTSSGEHNIMMTTRAALKSSRLLLQDSSSDSDSEDSYEYRSYMTYTIDLMTPCILSSRLYQSSQAEPVAFVDGGTDSCIGGIGWKVLSYTGRKANLVG